VHVLYIIILYRMYTPIKSLFCPKVNNVPDFREPMKKREWTFSKFVDELKGHMGREDEYLYYQDTLTDTVGSAIKHDFVHFNWRWLNERKKRAQLLLSG